MKKTLFLLIIFVLSVSCNKNENKDKSIVEKIAQANGMDSFEEVEELQYTFNVRVNDTLRTSRKWTWRPQDKTATLKTADSTVAYNYEKEADKHRETDKQFINDKYWLLFPFQLVWDEMEYEHETKATAPISQKNLQKVRVSYPEGAGYTPGDVYEIYFGDDHVIKEWTYMPGGDESRAFTTTWEDYQDFNGINIATSHRSEDGSFELFFTDVKVEK